MATFPYAGEKVNGIFEIRAFQTSPGKMAVMLLDITQRKQAEEAMHRTSRLEVTTTLAGGIAHEFNNLMVGVLGNAELLKMKLFERPDLEDSLTNICDAAQKAGQLAQQMLAYARGGKYMSEHLSLNDFIHEILRHQERSFPSRIRVDCVLEPQLWTLEADPTQMSQVISNLCANAVESIEDQGEITIKTHNLEVKEGYSCPYPDLKPNHYVSFSIEDTGCGMDSETQSKVFEPFFSTKFRGRGLGLAAVYGIVKNHGGLIKVTSQVDRGSKFEVFLPALLTEKKGLYSREPATLEQTGSKTILVIDDDETVLSVARDILESLGYQVLIASGGEEAIQITRKHPKSIDVALLDMWMPHMRGLEVYPYLKETRPDLKVILCSGYDLDESAQALLDAGAESFLPKPYRIEDISREIQKALAR